MDPALWEVIAGGARHGEVAVLARLRPGAAPPTALRVIARFGDIVTARVARGAILEAREDPSVVSLKAAREVRPEPAVRASVAAKRPSRPPASAWRPRGTPPTGRGVVVGVVDWGLDVTHPNLLRRDGRTRLLALWDQRPRRGRALAPYGYGRTWSAREIDAALGSHDPFAALGYDPADADLEGDGTHGTHVIDIAAGVPRHGPGGVAPGADLVFVHLASEATGPRSIGNSVSLLEAIDFIGGVAGERPCVINLSLGSHAGPHDGTTLVEQALDAFVTARAGRAIVQSAGNYRRAPVHASGRLVRDQPDRFEWLVSDDDETVNELDLWYPGADRVVVRLRDEDLRLVANATPDSHGPIVFRGQEVGRFAHRTHDPNNGDNQVALILNPTGVAVRWVVEIAPVRVASADARWHAWIERDEGRPSSQSRLRSRDASSVSTIGTIANGRHTIVVGALDPTTGRVAPFSSVGPTRDGRYKPDVIAPGVGVVAARSTPANGEARWLTRKSGTSMAAPHVTGLVALVYERAGRPIGIAELRSVLGIGDGAAPTILEPATVLAAAHRLVGGAAPMPAPARIFDGFTVPARAHLRFAWPELALVAAAGAAPMTEVVPGDLLIERALGEGDLATLTVVDEPTAANVLAPRLDRIVVRRGPAVPTDATGWRFRAVGRTPALARRRARARARPAPARRARSANPRRAEAIDGFVDSPAVGRIDVGRRGLLLRLPADARYVAGLDRSQQVLASWIRTLVGDAYTPLLAQQVTSAADLELTIQGLEGPAKDGEPITTRTGAFGTVRVATGLELVHALRDQHHLRLRLDDARLRRLEQAVAVEHAWDVVYAQTKEPGLPNRPRRAVDPPSHRHAWVTQALFTDVAWSLGAEVEALRASLADVAGKLVVPSAPASDAQRRAMGALWATFNRGADPLEAVLYDPALRDHPGSHYLFAETYLPAGGSADERMAARALGHAARVRFIEVCLGRFAALAPNAISSGSARRVLLDKFTADYKALLDWSKPSLEGDDPLAASVAVANAAPFPSTLRVAPPGPAYPAGGELAAEMGVRADHWLSLWDYRYHWDLLRLDADQVAEVSSSGWTSFTRRIDRAARYTWTDYQRLRDELSASYGPPQLGAATMAGALGLLRIAGTVVSDALRAVFERPYEKSLVLPGPGIYFLRCSAGDPDRSGALVRVPSVAYQLLFVLEPAELSQRKAEQALEVLRQQALELPHDEALVASGALTGEELTQAKDAIAATRAALDGSGAALYGLQRANLVRARADDALLARADRDVSRARRELDRRIAEIDRILRQRADNLARVVGRPYRVFAVLVADLGPVLHLMVEVVDVEVTAATATVHVVDATATHSGWHAGTASTRLAAIRTALRSLLENKVTGYGRGYCTILVPAAPVTGLGEHLRDTFRVDLDSASMLTELIEGGAMVASILALLAAPFTGGASLALLIPLGVIGAIPSAYRLVKRHEQGTFAWDLETALDLVNIASAVFGLSQTASGGLKLTRLAKAFQLSGHGADGLGLLLGTDQFFEELAALSADATLLPNQRRLAMAIAVANKLVNDGVMVGHALAMRTYGQMLQEGMDPARYPLGPGVLPEVTALPPVRERAIPKELAPASKELHDQVRQLAGRDVPVLRDPALAGATAEVRYVLDAYGFISEIYLAFGPDAGAAQVPSHAATARQLGKFTGVVGKARTLIDWARAFFARDPSLKVGKARAWEARVELEKLPRQVSDVMRGVDGGLRDGSMTPARVDAYLRGLWDQLAEHEAALRDASPARGRVAAEDRSAPAMPAKQQQLVDDGRAQALVVLGIEAGKLTIRLLPGQRGEVRAGARDGGQVEIVVPEYFGDGTPNDAVDIRYAAEDLRDRAARRPADPTRPEVDRPWDGPREAAYRGLPSAEPGYRWELAADGTLRYVGHPPRVYDPTAGRMARDPAAPVTPRRPRPTEARPSYQDEIVPGFYAGTDPDAQLAGWRIEDTPIPPRQLPPTVVGAESVVTVGSHKALVRNSYAPDSGELSLDVHFFHHGVPTRVATQPAMFEGLSPTAIWLTLRQMRQLGIEPGTLRRLRLHQIQNVETVMQVDTVLRAQGATLTDPMTPALAAKLEATALGLYARSIARQSGHVVTGVEVDARNAETWRLGRLMSIYENLPSYADPVRARKLHDRLLADLGMARDATVTTDFDLVLLLEDAP